MFAPDDKKNASPIILIEHRCSCGKLLFKGLLLSSTLEIKCKRCNTITVIGNNHESTKSNLYYSMLFDLNGHIIDVSPSTTQILGYAKEELVVMKIQQIDPLFRMSHYVSFSNTKDFSSPETFTWDTIHQNKKGAFSLVKTSLRYIKNPTGMYGLATFECLPESNHAMHETTEQKTATQCTLSAKINTEGIYIHVATKLATLLGYSSLEMLGKYISHFHPVKQQEKIQDILFQNLATKESFKLSRHAMLCKNKDIVNLETYFASDFNDSGQFTGFKMMSWQV